MPDNLILRHMLSPAPFYTQYSPPKNQQEVDLRNKVNRLILGYHGNLLHALFNGGRVDGKLFRYHSLTISLSDFVHPIYGELRAGQWVDESANILGNGFIELLSYCWNKSYQDAVQMIDDHLRDFADSLKIRGKVPGWIQEVSPIHPFIRDVPDQNSAIYRAPNGQPFCKVIRQYDSEGRFFSRYLLIMKHKKSGQSLLIEAFPDPPYRLFNLDQIIRNPLNSVVITTDEFDANKCFKMGVAFSTVPGGIDNLLDSDLSPLENRIVCINFSSKNLCQGLLIEKKLRETKVKEMYFAVNYGKWHTFSKLKEEAKKYCVELISVKEGRLSSDDLVVHGFQGFMKIKTNEFGWVVENLIPQQGIAMVYAPRGVGKTFFSLSLALACAEGAAFLKWKAPLPKKVLYIDGEMSASVMQSRIKSICKGQMTLRGDNFNILTPDCQAGPMPDLSTKEGQNLIAPHLKGVSLLVVDNIATLCRSGNENTGESWNVLQSWLLELRRKKISVLLVHHAGKNGAQRGTSKREDILDTIISLKRPSTYSSVDGARFEVHFEKHRHVSGTPAKPFEASLVSERGTSTWVLNELEDDLLNQVCELFQQNLSVREVAYKLKISKSSVGRMRTKLKEDGWLREADSS